MSQMKTGRDRGDGATRKGMLERIAGDFPGNDCGAQRARMLAAIRQIGHVTTTEARLFLEIMNPSQRVTELRNEGEHIDTTWAVEPSEAGRAPHRQARYVLAVPIEQRAQAGVIRPELAGWLMFAIVAGLMLAGVLR